MIPSKKIWASPQTPKGRETKRQRDKETKRQRDKETKRQRNKDSRCNKRPADPEAEVVDPLAGAARDARRRAENVWREVPGTAAVHMVVAVAAFDPGRTIRRRVIIIVVDAILDPLIDVADHVIGAMGESW